MQMNIQEVSQKRQIRLCCTGIQKGFLRNNRFLEIARYGKALLVI